MRVRRGGWVGVSGADGRKGGAGDAVLGGVGIGKQDREGRWVVVIGLEWGLERRWVGRCYFGDRLRCWYFEMQFRSQLAE